MRTFPLILIAASLAGGCTVGSDFAGPPTTGAQSGYAEAQTPRAALGQSADGAWWKTFRSPDLDALVDRALAGNQSLAAGRETLVRARERINAIAGRKLPQVDANGRMTHQQVNLSAFGLSDGSGSSGFGSLGNPEFDLYTLGAGISYDLDLFGGNRRALEQANAEAEAQAHQTAMAHQVIAGRVVLQVLAIAALNDRIATEQALLSEDERNVTLTQARYRAGAGTLVEVLSAQGQLASDRANVPSVQQQRAEARGMLAVLLGLSPAELGATEWSLDQFTLPVQVPVALPSELVHKRPDILEAEARLHAATAAIGIAEARLYPDVTLGASLTQSTTHPGNLLSGNYSGFDFFAGLTAPIFHGGSIKAEKRGAEANARAAAAMYRQVVLDAFGQVSGLLSALETDGRLLDAERQSASISERSLNLSRRSFQVGNSGILQVLDASRAYQRARISLLDARARQYINIARLYAATAGGWTSPAAAQEPAPE